MNKLAFWRERRAGRCKAPRRRRCGDIVEERQRRRCPPAAAPRRAAAPMPADYYGLMIMFPLGMRAAAKCQIILARALNTGTNCFPLSGLPLLLYFFPGLTPWAFLSRPFGASFAAETSQAEDDRWILDDPPAASWFAAALDL